MKTFVCICLVAILSGCGTVFDNALTVTLTGDRAFVTSLYGPIGITAELRDADAAELRRLIKRGE